MSCITFEKPFKLCFAKNPSTLKVSPPPQRLFKNVSSLLVSVGNVIWDTLYTQLPREGVVHRMFF